MQSCPPTTVIECQCKPSRMLMRTRHVDRKRLGRHRLLARAPLDHSPPCLVKRIYEQQMDCSMTGVICDDASHIGLETRCDSLQAHQALGFHFQSTHNLNDDVALVFSSLSPVSGLRGLAKAMNLDNVECLLPVAYMPRCTCRHSYERAPAPIDQPLRNWSERPDFRQW
jgi:hypothetical protein